MEFDGNIPLCHGPGLVVRTCAGDFEVSSGNDWAYPGPHTLLVLAAFATPRSTNDALKWLKPHLLGAQAAMDFINVISTLVRHSVLVAHEVSLPVSKHEAHDGYGATPVHVAMLNDKPRTMAWLGAIRAVVKPGDVVVEIGTGTGVLAIAAAQAGARHVYAIEATAIADTAERMVRANGVADRVTIVRGWSTQVELPEQGDVFVAELLGNDPFGENVLQITSDAARRLLRPDARFMPNRVRLWATLVKVPDSEVQSKRFTQDKLEDLERIYGQDFSALASAIGPMTFYASPRNAKSWKVLSEPGLLLETSLAADVPHAVTGQAKLTSIGEGSCNGVLLHFDAEVGPNIWVSTDVTKPDGANHWGLPVYLLAATRALQPSQVVGVQYRYDGRPSLNVEW